VIRVQLLSRDSVLRETLARQPGLLIVDADPDVLVVDTDGRSPEEIAAAIQALDPVPAGATPGAMPGAMPGATLTPRERQVLTLLADGLGNKIIAARLGISDHTVKAHVAAIFEKLGVSTRAEAASVGLRRGLIAL
jgi:two-component system, NarL family, nitrate/nitrite response regulator NarL